jgi:hypothetical protein
MKLMNGTDLITESPVIEWNEREQGWQAGNTVYVDTQRSYTVVQNMPNSISMRQARLQLLAMNLLDAVNTQISTMPTAAQIEWEYATEVKRDNPLVLALQTALSMTDSDMDLFFSDAIQL